ncbi:MAG: hypothetical protein RL701_4769 [Pseudomonadota bacterium]|jgi:osmotically-inducible protein OsmY
MKRTDAELKAAVTQELKWDTRVNETALGVAVDGGVVTLTGTATSWAEKAEAQAAAHRVFGVQDVANDIEVRLTDRGVRSDADIALALRTALEWNVFVPEQRIHSTVSNGWVTIEGDVENGTQRAEVEKAVAPLMGVRGVINKISVRAPMVDPVDVRDAVKSALERRASREAAHIAIDVHGHAVTLSGVVHSWAERSSVLGAARGTRGVSDVHDRLSVLPWS